MKEWLLQNAYLKDKLINISNAKQNYEYICPICKGRLSVNNKKGFIHIDNPELNESCALSYLDKTDKEISKKYSHSNPTTKYNNIVNEDFEPVEKVKYKNITVDFYETINIAKLLAQSDFTKGQKEVFELILNNVYNEFEDKKMFVIQGNPGVGKSYTMSILIKIFQLLKINVKVGTFTGKASQVLRDKGVDSNTLHSLMYKPNLDDKGKIIGWNKNDDIDCEVLFVDEFSMLSKQLIEDILNYDKVTIFLGDKNQLFPIGEQSMYLENKIDLELNEIVRQSKGNPIIEVLGDILKDKQLIPNTKIKNDKGLFYTVDTNKDKEFINKLKNEYEIMLCGTNKMRHKLNYEYRKNKNYGNKINIGERLIVLKNDKFTGVFNGQMLEVVKVLSNPKEDEAGFKVVDILTDDGTYTISIDGLINPNFNHEQYCFENKVNRISDYEVPVFVNWGYAVTVFKSQGSEYSSALIFAKDMDWIFYRQKTEKEGRAMYKRAIFTAISRAKEKCVVVL